MTATVPTADHKPLRHWSAFAIMARRSVVGFFRQPAAWILGAGFPLLITAVSASAFSRATQLQGFPDSSSFLQFLLAGTMLQGVLFGSITASTDLALDIENGFMDRLLASPVSRVSILVSRLAGAAAYGVGITVFYVIVFALFGAKVHGGVAGVGVMIVLMVLMAIGVGGYGAAMGLRTGSAEAVGSSFPIVFIALFVSSAFFPVQTMSGVYKVVATINPITYVIDATRHQVLVGFDMGEALIGFSVAVGFASLMMVFALTQLRRRLREAS